ncbi:energy transducer TonB [Stutzerimonas chloritidismutans]|uniref:energy transducer TonB n=1 Tax=Stutzerimonas chloritidismutans TaxID=203192 RepID=UPI003F14AFC1
MVNGLTRVGLSFIGACVVAVLLFVLMLSMVNPPRDDVVEDPIAIANFVRMDTQNESTATRSRQQAPQPPQPKTPQPPTPPTPDMATPNASLPKLDLPLPNIDTGMAVASAPAPSLSGLAAAETAPAPPAPAPAAADAGRSGGPEQEVMPLNDVRPEYPYRARQRGIEGHIKLAFTITPAGRVENIRVVEASPPNVFDREARRAAARWRFAPRTENGAAVAREAVKTLHFRLQGDR